MKVQQPSFEINVEFEGEQYWGTYSVSSGRVNVQSHYGSKSTQVGNSDAKTIAKMLLREILQEAKANGDITI